MLPNFLGAASGVGLDSRGLTAAQKKATQNDFFFLNSHEKNARHLWDGGDFLPTLQGGGSKVGLNMKKRTCRKKNCRNLPLKQAKQRPGTWCSLHSHCQQVGLSQLASRTKSSIFLFEWYNFGPAWFQCLLVQWCSLAKLYTAPSDPEDVPLIFKKQNLSPVTQLEPLCHLLCCFPSHLLCCFLSQGVS